MRSLFFPGLLIIVIVTSNLAWGQNLPSDTSLTVEVLPSYYSYKADDGTTVVLGEVQNNNNFPITDVKVGISFLNDNDNTIEYKTGTTLLHVVPAGGKAPFSISSSKSDPSITQVSAKMSGFISSSAREQALDISPGLLQVSDKLSFSGTIKNNGVTKSTNTKIYLVSYDAFQRVVGIGTSDSLDVDSGQDVKFSITVTSNSRAKSYMVIAESDTYQSKLVDVPNVQVTLPVAISSILVTDPQGNKYSTIPAGSTVKISSELKYIVNKAQQSFVYYVQVKQFDGQVTFIGKHEGIFLGAGDQSISVTWTPDTSGSYYIETYVWNSDNIPLSSAGTRINVVLVKS